MRRSSQVAAPLLASAAVALLAGCHHGPEMQRCVDPSGHVVDAALCRTGTGSAPGLYRYYYGGRGSYAPGSVVTGGSAAPEAGHSYSTTTGTARGGFGSSFGSSGEGGGSEGGGHGGGAGE